MMKSIAVASCCVLLICAPSRGADAQEDIEVFPETPVTQKPDKPAEKKKQKPANRADETKKSAKSSKVKHTIQSDKKALASLNNLVGNWRGQGQPKRGSNVGAWTTTSTWRWDFSDKRAAIVFAAGEHRYYSAGKILPGDKPGTFEFTGTLPDGKTTERYTGSINSRDHLILNAQNITAGRPVKITIRNVAGGARMIIRYDKFRGRSRKRTMQLAEIGLTRKGSGFGKGSRDDDCVVTGGQAESFVSFGGKRYPVCCSGCRDSFTEDPEGTLKEWRERLAKEKAEAKEE